MSNTCDSWKKALLLSQELIEQQRNTLLRCGRCFVPTLTPEDMLQPNDYPELEHNPHFRYEEGFLAGLLALQMALQAAARDKGDSVPFDPLAEAVAPRE